MGLSALEFSTQSRRALGFELDPLLQDIWSSESRKQRGVVRAAGLVSLRPPAGHGILLDRRGRGLIRVKAGLSGSRERNCAHQLYRGRFASVPYGFRTGPHWQPNRLETAGFRASAMAAAGSRAHSRRSRALREGYARTRPRRRHGSDTEFRQRVATRSRLRLAATVSSYVSSCYRIVERENAIASRKSDCLVPLGPLTR
jgi:hypothetical protein